MFQIQKIGRRVVDRSYQAAKITFLILGVALWVTGRPALAQQRRFPSGAHWIAAGPSSGPALPLFRRAFSAPQLPMRATLKISGLGQFEAHLNGANITQDLLTPGWTDYSKRVLYDTFDVTTMVHAGKNMLGVMLGNGMFNLQRVQGRYAKIVGPFKQPRLIASLTLIYPDGSYQILVTDTSWQVTEGPITLSSAYGGEDYDAQREISGWDRPGPTSGAWRHAVQIDSPRGSLHPEISAPVRAFEGVSATRVSHPSSSSTIYDLGQNIAGWPEIEVQGTAGVTVRLIAGELLDASGFVTQRSANAFPDSANIFTYTLRGGAPERWHPRFSYYGFRYVEVSTSGGEVNLLHLRGRVLHANLSTDGIFASSSDLLNRIHLLIDRAMLSNLFSVITDCPQREKLGWLEQTHLAGAALMYNYGLAALYAKVSNDMQDAQTATGLIPDTAPEFEVFPGPFRDSPEWGSAVVLSPWIAYQFYGDLEPLREHYDSMLRYAAYLKSRSQDGLLTFGLGDWYDIGPGQPGISKLTSPGVTATASYYELLTDLSKIATILRKSDDATRFANEATAVRQAFNRHFFNPDINQYDTGSQTANAMPLVVGLAPEDRRDAILGSLIADIHAHHNHVTAGDIGFHYVVRALTDGDRSDVLYNVLMRTDSPSYGYQLARGATTLTESWDANPNSSQNHFMLGHAEEWFYRGLAGIEIDLSKTGAERLRLHAALPDSLQQAGATFQSALGKVSSSWQRNTTRVCWTLDIPVQALVTLPKGYRQLMSINGRPPSEHARPSQFILKPGRYRLVLSPK
jgi:alpha-L-rhamnosidase